MEYLGSDRFILQLATGKVPFSSEGADHQIVPKILKGRRPSKPARFEAPGMTAAVWKIAEKCWSKEPEERLKANAVLQRLQGLDDTGECT